MPRKPSLPVTSAELDVLGVLWDQGPATLRTVHEQLAEKYAYTTVQTMLDRLVVKGLVERDRNARPARHRAKVSRGRVMKHYLGLVLEKVCEGPAPLVLQLLREQNFSPDELAEIKRLIHQFERAHKENTDAPARERR